MFKTTFQILIFLQINFDISSQNLKLAFLDSIDVNVLIEKSVKIDTIIKNIKFSHRIDYTNEIVIFGNLNQINIPDGQWIYTFRNDTYEFVKGKYSNVKRDGFWFIGCGARKEYENGKILSVSYCKF